MKKYIGLMCGAVLLALLAVGCSGSFGFDGKDVGDSGLGDDSNKDNPFKGTTWEDSTNGITLVFDADTCEITTGTTKSANIARAAQITDGTYSYTCDKSNSGMYTATLAAPDSDLQGATFTISGSGASKGILTLSDGGYTLTKKTGSGGSGSGGGSTVVDANNPFADTTWKVLSGITDLVFTKDTVTYANLDYSYTIEKKDNGSYTATLTSKLNGSSGGTFVIDTLHSPYGRYTVSKGATYTCLKSVAAVAEDYQIEDGKLVKYVGKQESITIPTSVKWIGNEAFKDCDFIESVRIPTSVKSIGKEAFEGCSSLKTVLYNGTSNQWRHMLFYYDQQGETIGDATGLKGKTIVNTTTNGISWYFDSAVSYWKSTYANSNTVGMQIETYVGEDENLTIPAGATQIRDNAFDTYYGTHSYIVSVTIPNTVTDIGRQAFRNRKKLETAVISGTMASIGESAFNGCELLKKVTISEGVASIKNNAFQGCSSLASISIPGSVTDTGTNIFADCASLTEVKICEGMTKLGDRLFENCSTIQNVTMPESMTSIGAWTFSKCSGLESVTIPANVTSIGERAFGECTGLTSMSIPDGVTSIENQTFYRCSNLESVTIPASVTSIGNSAFYGCTKLTSVDIPDSMMSIGNFAFYECDSLTSVSLSSNVVSIGLGAFGCCKNLTSMTIPDGVTRIENQTFSGCSSLESVTIPASVKSIGNAAFSLCSKLTTITYHGTKDMWNEITIDGATKEDLEGKTITGKDADGNETTWTVD